MGVLDLTGLGSIAELGGKIIDKLWPNKDEAEKAKLQLLQLQQAGEFKELEERMKAITTEASSADPWTSRARPTFMYVVYVLILAALPFSIFYAIRPDVAMQVVAGFKAWLNAIPESMLALFGSVMLGYTVARSYEKGKGVA